MKIAVCTLESSAPYSQSRAHETEKLPRETADAYEERTWRNKAHIGPAGKVIIPQMSFKMALDAAAKQLGLQIPGKGKSTYTKFFRSGVLCTDAPELPIAVEDLIAERVHANADGVRGSGKRVWRKFPVFQSWRADVLFHVLADEITPDVFEQHLIQSGRFIGIGRFRPENGGYFGRFEVKSINWQQI